VFVGRERELALLQQAADGAKSAFVPIYGRRRVGKTELIRRFLAEHSGLYFVGKAAPAGLQLRDFMRAAARATGEPLLAELAVDGWERALDAVTDRWPGPGKLIIALDEFQWTAQASPELPSVLQALCDQRWKPSRKVLLILCGSYVGFMEREVLGNKSPLFGRRTGQIQMSPLGYRDAAELRPLVGRGPGARLFRFGRSPRRSLDRSRRVQVGPSALAGAGPGRAGAQTHAVPEPQKRDPEPAAFVRREPARARAPEHVTLHSLDDPYQ